MYYTLEPDLPENHFTVFILTKSQNDRDATKARNEGAGIMFQGRPCRT